MAGNTSTRPNVVKRKRDFIDDEQFSDIIIKFGNKQIFAHKVILAKGSVWFKKAFVGQFEEATKQIIDLGDREAPEVVAAMIGHIYGHTFSTQGAPGPKDKSFLQFAFEIFKAADFYDVQTLRAEMVQVFRERLDAMFEGIELKNKLCDCVIEAIQLIIGPDAPQCADNSLASMVEKRILEFTDQVLRSDKFVSALVTGQLLKEEFGVIFMRKVCLLVEGETGPTERAS